MSILSDLEAALDAALASEQTKGKVWDDFRDLCDTDTIAALVAVARAAWRLLHEDGYESELDAHLAPLVKEADCPTCHGHGGGGGFDRNGSHAEDRYCEYPCPTCGKEADDE